MRSLSWLLALPVLLAACSSRSSSDARPSSSAGAIIRPEPRPGRVIRFDARQDGGPLLKAGCVPVPGVPTRFDCQASEAIRAMGCYGYPTIDDHLGGFAPGTTVAECKILTDNRANQTPPGLLRLGCLLPVHRRLIAVRPDGKATLIATADELARQFAPVESPAEALAFALALSEGQPATTIEIPPGADVKLATIEPAYVEPVSGGYKVHLLEPSGCGGPLHYWKVLDLLVTREGQVTVTARQDAFDDPKQRGMYVD